MAVLNFGDIIYVERAFYKHFGIYSGNGNVIHYVKDSGEGIIKETSIKYFLGNENICHVFDFEASLREHNDFINKLDDKTLTGDMAMAAFALIFESDDSGTFYSPEETVKRAKSFIGKSYYNLIFSNCEHFAIWCKTGLKESMQVEKFISVAVWGIFKMIENL